MPFQYNLSNLKQETATILATEVAGSSISELLQDFLTAPDSTKYNALWTAIQTVSNLNIGTSGTTNVRVMVVTSDGRVVIDSKNNTTNTWTNYSTNSVSVSGTPVYVSGLINENHAGRPEIEQAILSSAGEGSTLRYSSTSSTQTAYYALRLGVGANKPDGVLRISYDI